MHKTSKLTLTLIALLTGASIYAQTPTTSSTNGLLGQRYAELSGNVIDPHGTSDEGFGGDISVNLPLQAGLDLGVGYSYSRIKADLFSGVFRQSSRDHTLYTSLVAYQSVGSVKPFFGAALGHQWSKQKLSFAGTPVLDDRDNEALWSLGAGVEIPVGSLTVTPSVAYQDGFKRDSTAGFAYGVDANMWVTRQVGAFAGVSYSDPTGGGIQSWSYKAGVRFRF